jgi:hypothetical protein
MAKGQLRGNREAKKPKQAKKLVLPASAGGSGPKPIVVPPAGKEK